VGYSTVLQQNDIGVTFVVQALQQDGVTPQDISGATQYTIYIKPPNGEYIAHTAALVTNGTDGQMYYNSVAGDLGSPGIYKIRASYAVSGGVIYSKSTQFLVEVNGAS
jgi:hypothetical protein